MNPARGGDTWPALRAARALAGRVVAVGEALALMHLRGERRAAPGALPPADNG